MSVLLPNRNLGVRHRSSSTVDTHGDRAGLSWAALLGPWPGRAEQGPDVPVGQAGGRTWVLALDPAAWPVNQGDLVVGVGSGEEWLVLSADLLANNADDSVDYVRVEAHTRVSTSTAP